jgi:hypothetical protein
MATTGNEGNRERRSRSTDSRPHLYWGRTVEVDRRRRVSCNRDGTSGGGWRLGRERRRPVRLGGEAGVTRIRFIGAGRRWRGRESRTRSSCLPAAMAVRPACPWRSNCIPATLLLDATRRAAASRGGTRARQWRRVVGGGLQRQLAMVLRCAPKMTDRRRRVNGGRGVERHGRVVSRALAASSATPSREGEPGVRRTVTRRRRAARARPCCSCTCAVLLAVSNGGCRARLVSEAPGFAHGLVHAVIVCCEPATAAGLC